mmetsp:Transcript_21829/g.47667  ORF Transcript_21829/g.47667 Transcript_21829/m.47667 type:complete len:92 (-) Transcript_21829:606-881(-)
MPSATASSAQDTTPPNTGALRAVVTTTPAAAAATTDTWPRRAIAFGDAESFIENAPFRFTNEAATVHPQCIEIGKNILAYVAKPYVDDSDV